MVFIPLAFDASGATGDLRLLVGIKAQTTLFGFDQAALVAGIEIADAVGVKLLEHKTVLVVTEVRLNL